MIRGVDATPPEGPLRASFSPAPSPSLRDSEIGDAKETALLIIDAQNYNCTRAGALWNSTGERSSAEDLRYFFSRLQGGDESGSGGDSDSDNNPGVIRNWVALVAAARSAGARVVFTGESTCFFGATGERERENEERGRNEKLTATSFSPSFAPKKKQLKKK